MADAPAQRHAPVVAPSSWLGPLPPAARFILRGAPEVLTAAGDALGLGFSAVACRAAVGAGRAALWLGPDEQLLLAPEEGSVTMRETLQSRLRTLPHSLVDISHRQVALAVSGAHAEPILNGGCPLDLDRAAFPVGMCTRTVFAKAEIVLWRTEPQTFRLEIWRSFTEYVAGLLVAIASEYGV